MRVFKVAEERGLTDDIVTQAEGLVGETQASVGGCGTHCCEGPRVDSHDSRLNSQCRCSRKGQPRLRADARVGQRLPHEQTAMVLWKVR